MITRRIILLVPALLLGAVLGCSASLLVNGDFESDPQGSTSSVLEWTSYSVAANRTTSETGASAHTGTNYFKVYQSFNNAVNYNGIYQDRISGPGTVYTAAGWGFNKTSDALAGQNNVWIEVTFRDAAANILALYKSATITTNLISSGAFPRDIWNSLPVTNRYNPSTFALMGYVTNLVAPDNTSFVRYQIVFQGDAKNSGGSMYFDDLDLTQVDGGPQYGTTWNLTWADEFNATNINTSTWKFDLGTGSGGWGNLEQEYYTSRATNVFDDGSMLHIVARKENMGGAAYTSARMKSDGLFSHKYGRIEYRAKLPTGQGYWPALWLMPQDSVYGGWAASGEIDVMENMGNDPHTVLGTLHYGGTYPNNTQSNGPHYHFLPTDSVTNFHVYTLEWATNAINFFVDGQLYENLTTWNTTAAAFPAPFNENFFLLINLAVGGNFGGNASTNTVFPGEMLVDYVRIYDQVAALQITATQTATNLMLTWPASPSSHLQQNIVATSTNFNTGWTNVAGAASPFAVTPDSDITLYRLVSP